MNATAPINDDATTINNDVAEGGAYEVLNKRLNEQGNQLTSIATQLNQQRLDEFGNSQMEVIGRLRIQSENNCVGRDIVEVGNYLLFGYNVFIGLKRETQISDVFSLYQLQENNGQYDVIPVDLSTSFLANSSFVQDFRELYTYYKNTRLVQLMVKNNTLLAAFQIGDRITDVRVFRWSISSNGKQEIHYLDNRGERDMVPPSPFDFEWTRATREMAVLGRHSHLNILDTIFVETIGGTLTIKVENNTEDGLGIYSEPVLDPAQSLDDGHIEFAAVGRLILLKILPYRESEWRYLVFNTITQNVQRIDAIGLACIQLPEDHGIIFPGGYYLESGETKLFEQSMQGMHFKRVFRSPNGEDVLYIFYEPESGRSALFNYNMIARQLSPPIVGLGYARLDDGRMIIFSADNDEPTRVHPMQIWRTPFTSDEFAARQPNTHSFMGRIGNADLVRGISDLFNLAREIHTNDVSLLRYQQLIRNTRRLFDLHYWFNDNHCGNLSPLLHHITATSESILDEYEKVQSIRKNTQNALIQAQKQQKLLFSELYPEQWKSIQEFINGLNGINQQRGHLLTIREYRYMDTAAIDGMENELIEKHQVIATATAEFLAHEKAFLPLLETLKKLEQESFAAKTVLELNMPLEGMKTVSADLDMLAELIQQLNIEDATLRTQIIESISDIYSQLNQNKAKAQQLRQRLAEQESSAQFTAQFNLYSQSITNALNLSNTPERCEEQLAKLLIQLEQLESQFGEYEIYLSDILAKREELIETFSAHKQNLLDEQQRKAQTLQDAALRILNGLDRRTLRLQSNDELNSFFVTDPLILKIRELIERLRQLNDSVKADDIEARLKAARDQSVRGLRDRTDLFEGGGHIIKLGPRHRFSVNTQELDLTLLPKNNALYIHLTGTDYFEPIQNTQLNELNQFWSVDVESESNALYRGEYLAFSLLYAAKYQQQNLSYSILSDYLNNTETFTPYIREYIAARYREGYEKGVHDHDARLILQQCFALIQQAGNLIFAPQARSLAVLFWYYSSEKSAYSHWNMRAFAALQMQQHWQNNSEYEALQKEISAALKTFIIDYQFDSFSSDITLHAADYLINELAASNITFSFSGYAEQWVKQLQQQIQKNNLSEHFKQMQAALSEQPATYYQFIKHWLESITNTENSLLSSNSEHSHSELLTPYITEAAVLMMVSEKLSHTIHSIPLYITVEGLLGQHTLIDNNGKLNIYIDNIFSRLEYHQTQFIPQFKQYQQLRQQSISDIREQLRLNEFKPQPLTSFVRNRLINDIYLSLIGDNFAKQMGTVGESKRSDLMGLLMMISPPGYGKTTLMEYVAHRLGLIFMKINGPALGHLVRSLDPAQAPDATSRQELEKLNLALEMGNNVMLYLDDIQHTHPEFLQKFISLCDGTRRIEGVWKGQTRTYDMRGKKFCVVMAGNPYTESGELFKIPDMLANRADIYNLGEVLGGMEDAFKLSYIENCITSNPILAPLATRDLNDIYYLVDKAQGKIISNNELSYPYSNAELNEMNATLQHLITVRDIVYRVNQQYIISAAQSDQYRQEPAFRLQGSYRNMNKLAEKISPVMNNDELQQLIHDHYLGEAQLLTTGAEENLLKLADIRQIMTSEQTTRWENIKRDFMRNKSLGGQNDIGSKIVTQLSDLVEVIKQSQNGSNPNAVADIPWNEVMDLLRNIPPHSLLIEAYSAIHQHFEKALQQSTDYFSHSVEKNALVLGSYLETQQQGQQHLQQEIQAIGQKMQMIYEESKVKNTPLRNEQQIILDRFLEEIANRKMDSK